MVRPPPQSSLFPYTTLFRSVGVQITNTPNVAEMHAIYSAIVAAFRTFRMPTTVSTEDGEYVHEQTKFGSNKDRKSTRLHSSHVEISYSASCLKKKNYYAEHR